MVKNSNFSSLTKLYSLSKTLRFELKPVGKTLENMKDHLKFDQELQTFLKDQEIEDAYQKLKPVLDKLHEKFITESLDHENTKQLDFSPYFELYQIKKNIDEKLIQKSEKGLRSEITKLFVITANNWKSSAGKNSKNKEIFKESGYKILTEKGVLDYLKQNLDALVVTDQQETILEAIKSFENFFTYFTGFNQNRENYYSADEKATAVATRLIHDNLPKFCDNMITFNARQAEYVAIHKQLTNGDKNLVDKSKRLIPEIPATIFVIDYFSQCLSQRGLETYNQLIADCNFLINLYNQSQKDTKQFKKLSQFKTLYKQIGCGKKSTFFSEITHNTKKESDQQKQIGKVALSVEEVLSTATKTGQKYFSDATSVEDYTLPKFISFIRKHESYTGIYWSKAAINTISNKYFANWFELKEKLKTAKVFSTKKGGAEDTHIPPVVELSSLFTVLDETEDWKETLFKNSITSNEDKKSVIDTAPSASKALIELILLDMQTHADQFLETSTKVTALTEYISEESKNAIKTWIDHALSVNQMLRYFRIQESKIKAGNQLDAELDQALNTLLDGKMENQDIEETKIDWIQWHDLLRNYLTKKPQDNAKENKLKLNFENSTLADGWDINKESDNSCIILKDEVGKQFLAIISRKYQKEKGYNKIFEKSDHNKLYDVSTSVNILKKMEYSFWSDVSRMIPKCSTQLKGVIKHFKNSNEDFIFPIGYKVSSGETFTEECKITQRQFELNNKVSSKDDLSVSAFRYNLSKDEGKVYIKQFQKEYSTFDNNSYSEALLEWIEFGIYFLSKYPKTKNFSYDFKNANEYTSVDEFNIDVDKGSYKLNFVDVNQEIINEWADDGRIYLFEIRNQDCNQNKNANHKQNLHTMYWQTIFTNVENKPKLNGNAAIYYRKAVQKEKLNIKQDSKGKEIIENYRFSKDTFLFHVPITLNFSYQSRYFNDVINNEISTQKNTHFIGIDRGEKHLAYYSVVDQDGIIITQDTLNIPFVDKDKKPRTIKAEKRTRMENGEIKTEMVECSDYNDLLDARAGDRDFARKNWQTIGTIKELKDGYTSQVVRKIADLAVKHNAYIVMEDLNTGFKQGRQKIEKSVYQKLELALAKKLNFLVDKEAKIGELGSVTSALQLTPQVNNYGDIENRKQVGLILYTRANYTSQTDPITGWRKTIYLQKGSEEAIKAQIIEKFSDIRFDGSDYCFEYTDTLSKQWQLYSGKNGVSLDRFRGSRSKEKNAWTTEKHDINKILDKVFANFDKESSILTQIIDEDIQLTKIKDNQTAWESLRFAIDLIQQIRNTGVDKADNDFLQSPVRDLDGTHFDSRNANQDQPNSGDANGAFNIARKGIIMNEHIKRGYSLFIRDEEWDAWLAGKSNWENWIEANKKDLILKKKK